MCFTCSSSYFYSFRIFLQLTLHVESSSESWPFLLSGFRMSAAYYTHSAVAALWLALCELRFAFPPQIYVPPNCIEQPSNQHYGKCKNSEDNFRFLHSKVLEGKFAEASINSSYQWYVYQWSSCCGVNIQLLSAVSSLQHNMHFTSFCSACTHYTCRQYMMQCNIGWSHMRSRKGHGQHAYCDCIPAVLLPSTRVNLKFLNSTE